MSTSDRSSFATASIWSQLPNEAHSNHSRDSSNRSPHFNDSSSSPATSTTTTNTSPHSYHPQLDHPSSPRTNQDQYNSPRDRIASLKPLSSHQQYNSQSPDSRTRLSPSPSRLGQQSQTPSIEIDSTSSQTRGFQHQQQQPERSLQRPPGATRSASFGAYDTTNHTKPSQLNQQGLSATSSPFSPPLPSTNLAPPPPAPGNSSQTPQTSTSSSSTQPLLAEIFSGRPRPHFRSSSSYSHASPTSSSHDQPRTTSSGFNPSSPTISTQSTETPSYFAAPNRPPSHHINRARSQSSAPSFDAVNSSDRTSPVGMSSPYGAPGGGSNNGNGMSGLSQSFAADQHGWRPSNQNSSTVGGGGGLHFSASLPTTSAVGSPTFSSFTNGAAGRELSSSPSSRAPGAGYSPFARPSSSLAAGPPPSSNSARPGALLSQSFSTGWEDFEREREGRARVRDTWGVSPSLGGTRDLSNASTPGLSPFSRDSGRLTEETNQTELSSSLGTGDSTWGMPTGLGPGGVYKARRDYSLGAVGSGRKRSDSAWGGTRERVLREQDEEEDQDGSFAPPTKSGATSRRHSFAAFEAPFGRSSQTIGFHLPEEVHKEVSNGGSGSGGGGFGSMSSTTLSNGLRMGGMGSSAIDDDDLAADLNSLHLSLDAHAKEQQQQGRSTTTSTLHVGSMPVDFPPNRSRRFETSRSPPPSDLKSTLPPPSPSHGMSTLPGSPRATAEPFTPSFIARAAPPIPSAPSGISNSASVASRFFQAPSPLPPTTTNVIATATPGNGGGGGGSRFDFFGMPNQNQPQNQGQPPQQAFQNQYPNQHQQQQQNRFGLPPPSTQHGFYNPQGQNQGPPPPPHLHRAGPPPSLGSTFSPFAPSPYQSPSLPPPHLMNNQGPPPQQQQQQNQQGSSNYFSSPQQPPSTHLPHSIPPLPASATALTAQSQSDMNLGRGVPLHAIPPDAPLCIIGFKAGRKDLFFCEDPSLNLEEGDLVIVEADRGRDVGKYLKRCSIEEVHKFQQHMVELALGQLANPASMTAMGFGPTNQSSGGGGGGGQGQAGPAQLARMTKECQPKRIYAKAGPADTHALLAKAQDEVKALQLVRGKVAQKGLPMEILDAEWQWDRRKLTFYYTADQRVDFRELVRELFRIWKTRVWLCCLDQQQPGPDFF